MSYAREMPGQRRTRRPGPTVRLAPGWLPESHLLPDAVVAFVDDELTLGAHERAAVHLMQCTSCAADVDAQRQARAAVHSCNAPSVPAGLLASLHSIPDTTELSTMPDNLAVDDNGQLVAVQRPDRVSGGPPANGGVAGGGGSLGSREPLGSSSPFGTAGFPVRKPSRRAVQGAGVVMSGLMLSALALALGVEDSGQSPARQSSGVRPAQDGRPPAPVAPRERSSELNVVRLGVPQP
ncbi:MAG: anti-sigma factor family protein [Thermocrispum sp.]